MAHHHRDDSAGSGGDLNDTHNSSFDDEVLTPSQRQKQALFESIDYYKSYTRMYLDHLWQRQLRRARARTRRLRRGTTATAKSIADQIEEKASITRWILHVVIAVTVGLVAIFVSHMIGAIEEWRVDTVTNIVVDSSGGFLGYVKGLVFWMASGVGLVGFATCIVVYFEPAAGGSGIPEVMAYLNGVALPKVLNLRTFIGKTLSVIGAVAGGLPVGSEAPLIHLGAIVGAGVPQGRSRTMGCQTSFFREFRNHKSRRDFITAGAACGVSAAFGAPIGGLLFVMEEVSSFWDLAATAQVFLATLITFAVSAFVNSMTEDTRGRRGFVSNKASVMFEVEYTGADPLNVASMFPAALLGLILGLLAVAFTKCHLMVVKWRRENIKPYPIKRVLEPILAVAIFAFVGFTLPYMLPCHPTVNPSVAQRVGNVSTDDVQSWHTENGTSLAKFLCPEPHEYSPLGTLTMSGVGKGAVRRLFSRRTVGEFSLPVLMTFLVLYTSFAGFIGGSALASGLVIPTIMIGAIVGRIYGLTLVSLFADTVRNGQGATVAAYFADQAWMDPGVFALIGAGAFFGGVSRMTISLCVIMVELSGELHYLLPIMIAIITAKSVADALCEPLYHQLMHLDFIPYLPTEVHGVDLELLTAGDACSQGAVCLQMHERVAVVIDALQSGHNCFPVVQGNRFVGSSSREDLQVLLALPQFQARVAETTAAQQRRAASPAPLASLSRSGSKELAAVAMPADDGALPLVDVSHMTYDDWLRHQMALFFVQGSKEWHRNWSPTGIAQRERDLRNPVSPTVVPPPLRSQGGPVAGFLSAAASVAGAAAAVRSSGSRALSSASSTGANTPPLTAAVPSAAPTSPAAPPRDDSIVMNLDPVMNRSPWVVPKSANLALVFQLFRTLGVRHLVVVEGDRVAGIITRKDLLPHELRLLLRRVQKRYVDAHPPEQRAGDASAARRAADFGHEDGYDNGDDDDDGEADDIEEAEAMGGGLFGSLKAFFAPRFRVGAELDVTSEGDNDAAAAGSSASPHVGPSNV